MIEDARELEKRAVTATEYLFPDGKRVQRTVHLTDTALAIWAKTNDVILSFEVLPSKLAVAYARMPDWDEEEEHVSVDKEDKLAETLTRVTRKLHRTHFAEVGYEHK